MKKIFALLLLLIVTLTHAQDKNSQFAFWSSIEKHCGKAYEGIITEGASDDFKGKKLVMHVIHCSKEEIKIPFHVGENRSRTWVLTRKNKSLTLKHDHRHEDGTEDKVTQYGGSTTNTGSANMQVFPADQETVQVIPAAFGNTWWVTIDEKTFTYNLRRIGTDRLFTVKFDLTKPVEIPPSPWGWKE
jgi:hypothetical protein